MYDYFVAPSDEVVAATLDGGPAHLPRVETKWLDPVVVMGNLKELLTGQAHDDVIDDERSGQLLTMEGDGEVLVLTVIDGLHHGLAEASELSGVATTWAQTEELRGWDPAQLADVLGELQALAKMAANKDELLYCWVCV